MLAKAHLEYRQNCWRKGIWSIAKIVGESAFQTSVPGVTTFDLALSHEKMQIRQFWKVERVSLWIVERVSGRLVCAHRAGLCACVGKGGFGPPVPPCLLPGRALRGRLEASSGRARPAPGL